MKASLTLETLPSVFIVKRRKLREPVDLYTLGRQEAVKLLWLLNGDTPGIVTKAELLRGLKRTARDQTEPGGRWYQGGLKRVIYMD